MEVTSANDITNDTVRHEMESSELTALKAAEEDFFEGIGGLRKSPLNSRNIEVEIHPSVPLDIALLHIETDALLDSLRKSALTPRLGYQLSPKTVSTSKSTSAESSSILCQESLEVSSQQSDEYELYEEEEDVESVLSEYSDDGMKGEIQKLHRATCIMQENFASFQDLGNDDSGCEVKAMYRKMLAAELSGTIIDSEDVFVRFMREVLMICEDSFTYLIRHQQSRRILRSKAFQALIKEIQTRPKEAKVTFAFLYVMLSIISTFLKTR